MTKFWARKTDSNLKVYNYRYQLELEKGTRLLYSHCCQFLFRWDSKKFQIKGTKIIPDEEPHACCYDGSKFNETEKTIFLLNKDSACVRDCEIPDKWLDNVAISRAGRKIGFLLKNGKDSAIFISELPRNKEEIDQRLDFTEIKLELDGVDPIDIREMVLHQDHGNLMFARAGKLWVANFSYYPKTELTKMTGICYCGLQEHCVCVSSMADT
jgi:hypothetical protein